MGTTSLQDLTPEELRGDGFNVYDAGVFLWESGLITDHANTMGERGYGDIPAGAFFAIGNLWCHDKDCDFPDTYEDGRKELHSWEVHYASLVESLNDAGVEFAFDDEWVVIDGTAYRTQPDSYGWESSIMFRDGDYITPEDGIECWVDTVVNDANRALPSWWSDADIESCGFVERECGLESGRYGVDDDPHKIMAAIQEREDDADVLFQLSSVEQFRVNFCVWVRADKGEDDANEDESDI